MNPADSIRRALQLLACASNDWRAKASDGTQPLHWTLATAAARAHLEHALKALEAPRIATPDDELGLVWWNRLTERERGEWLQRAGSAVPADAWTAYKAASAAQEVRTRKPA